MRTESASMDEEAFEMRPLENRRSEVVADWLAAGCVNASYEARKSEPAAAAATCPSVVVLSREPDAMDEIHRFVDEAVVAVIMVVDANGKELAVPSPRMVVVAVRPT